MHHRPAHLMTMKAGAPAGHEAPTTIHFMADLPGLPSQSGYGGSPFRPHRVGQYAITALLVDAQEALIVTEGGTIRLPGALVAYSYSV